MARKKGIKAPSIAAGSKLGRICYMKRGTLIGVSSSHLGLRRQASFIFYLHVRLNIAVWNYWIVSEIL